MNTWLTLLCLLGLFGAVFLLILSLRFRRKVRASWEEAPRTPHLLLIIPLKGLPAGLRETISAALSQDYPDYEVVVVLESPEDPAVPVLHQIQRESLVPFKILYGGQSLRRGGKIHNLLAGLAARGAEAEIFVFLDADARPPRRFLSYLVAPLFGAASGGIATGYRFMVPRDDSLASLLRVAWNAIPLHFMAEPRTCDVWGGATALSRQTFEDLKVRAAWDKAVSDDMALTALARTRRRPIIFAPGALVLDLERESLARFWRWGLRQVTLLRVCAPREWLFSTSAGLLMLLLYAGGGFYALSTRSVLPLLAWLPLLAQLVQGLFFVSTSRLIAARHSDPRFCLPWRVALAFPLAYLWLALQEISVTFRRTITWDGRTYRLEGPYRTTLLKVGEKKIRVPRWV